MIPKFTFKCHLSLIVHHIYNNYFIPKCHNMYFLFEDNPLPQDRKQPKSKQKYSNASQHGWVDSPSHVNLATWDQISLLPKVSAHCCLPPAACMRDVQKVSLLYACLYSVHPLLVKKAGVASDMTPMFTTCKQVSVQAREPPCLWNPWGGSHEVQNWDSQF